MLKSIQKQKLIKMLSPGNPPFKILILDTKTQEILSPILKISDLRDAGVTSHFLISNNRSQIKDAPAFYFISSSAGISNDIANDLYGSYYLNISYSFKRSELEEIAKVASQHQLACKVQSVYDQFLQFIAIEEDLFTLNINDSFINRSEPENLRLSMIGLFSIFYNLNEIPYIFSNDSDIGQMLEQKIKNTKNIKPSIKKPLLVILDREFDLVTPLKHQMGYVEIIHDVFDIKLNKAGDISLETESEFYKSNRFLDFPIVAETVDKELHSYKKELAIRSLTDKSDKAAIQAALDNAPHLQKKNEIVNSNINLCVKIVEAIKNRKIDDFYQIEENFDEKLLNELCIHGENNDIIRMCITALENRKPDLVDSIVKSRKIDLLLIDYIRQTDRNLNANSNAWLGSKMKNLLFKKNIPLYSYLENVIGQVKSQNFQGKTFDPSNSGIYLNEISKVIVYINGGVTYTELKAMKDFEKVYKLPVIIGGSEILNANNLIRQMSECMK